jgi:hypothetical protein
MPATGITGIRAGGQGLPADRSHLFEKLFFSAAFRAYPPIGQVFKSGPHGNIIFRITFGRVINIPTGALILVHWILLPLVHRVGGLAIIMNGSGILWRKRSHIILSCQSIEERVIFSFLVDSLLS